MQDRRQLPRKIASDTIQVRDINTTRAMGRVVNLTSEGLMLIGDNPIESNLIFQFELQLPQPHMSQALLQVGVESLWCSDANEPNYYWTGFRIIDISLDTIEVIESLVNVWEIDNELH